MRAMKKNFRGKKKRQQHKEEQLKQKLSKSLVDQANQLEDPLQPFTAFRKYSKDNLNVDLRVEKVSKLDEETKKWIFDLTKRNMKDLYNQCSWTWRDKNKINELMDESAWYLIAQSKSQLLGFSHFRFDVDFGTAVLYCYELQLEKAAQRKGLGKFMMQILELIAFTNQMKKIVLTILKHNPASVFFKTLKLDETCPVEAIDDVPYEILSKVNKKLSLEEVKKTHLHGNRCYETCH